MKLIALFVALLVACWAPTVFAHGGAGGTPAFGSKACPNPQNCDKDKSKDGSPAPVDKGRDVTTTKDVDNEKAERDYEEDEGDNEDREEKQETKQQEQKEQVTTTTHEGGSSEGNGGSGGSDKDNSREHNGGGEKR